MSANIWKIEVDDQQQYLALETREKGTTEAFISVFRFDGTPVLLNYPLDERDWSLDSLQASFVIFKKVGENTPTKEGVLVYDFIQGREVLRTYEYHLVDVFKGFLKVKHRMFASGMETYFALNTGTLDPDVSPGLLSLPKNHIIYPLAFTAQKPLFLESLEIDGELWMSRTDRNYLWCYHRKAEIGYELILCISDLNHILAKEVILGDLEKKIPQPFFQVGDQLFLMSYNKQEIVSYLV